MVSGPVLRSLKRTSNVLDSSDVLEAETEMTAPGGPLAEVSAHEVAQLKSCASTEAEKRR